MGRSAHRLVPLALLFALSVCHPELQAASKPKPFSATTPVSASGWGPFVIGKSVTVAEATQQTNYETEYYDDFEGFCWYIKPFGPDAPGVMVNANKKGDPDNGIVVRIESYLVDTSKPIMAKTLRVGATKAAILSVYPKAKRSPALYTNGFYLDAKLSSTTSVRFELNNSKIADSVYVGTPTAIQYAEGCA